MRGVAGAIIPGLHVGDIVVAEGMIQHDLDARPIFPRFEIPLYGRSRLETDAVLRQALVASARSFLSEDLSGAIEPSDPDRFGLSAPKVIAADVASGDRFVASVVSAAQLRRDLPAVACVEMEGAAVAQVCLDYQIRFGLVRTISDNAADHAHVDFTAFVKRVAGTYSLGVLRGLLQAEDYPANLR